MMSLCGLKGVTHAPKMKRHTSAERLRYYRGTTIIYPLKGTHEKIGRGRYDLLFRSITAADPRETV
jgi:hypothetical protein